jgi:hypothetical protein
VHHQLGLHHAQAPGRALQGIAEAEGVDAHSRTVYVMLD